MQEKKIEFSNTVNNSRNATYDLQVMSESTNSYQKHYKGVRSVDYERKRTISREEGPFEMWDIHDAYDTIISFKDKVEKDNNLKKK